tara:strand:+ start:124 stop:450 length:327 start_codon:yes stop_codon:yes gene_type:complete
MSDELLDTSDRKAVERAMKKTTLKDIDESATRTAKIEFEQENPIKVTIKKKPKKRSDKDEAIMKAEKQRRARAKNKAKPMGKKNGGAVNKKKIIRATKRGVGVAKRGF